MLQSMVVIYQLQWFIFLEKYFLNRLNTKKNYTKRQLLSKYRISDHSLRVEKKNTNVKSMK